MLNSSDCGPASVAAVTGVDLATVKRLWGWDDHNDVRDDLVDSPWAELAILVKLGVQWKFRNCGDVLADRCRPDKTVVMIHGQGLVGSLLSQHYIVYAGRSQKGNYLFHWGDGKPPAEHELTADDLAGYYSRGTPAFAYEVVSSGGHTKIPWYMRAYVWLLGRFA